MRTARRGAAISGFFPLTSTVVITKPDGTVLTIHNNGDVPSPLGPGFRCTKTDDNGNAVFEIQGSADADR